MKKLYGATLEGGSVTVSYNETLMGSTTAGTKSLKKGPAATALQAACTKAMGQATSGFQVYTQASDASGDGDLMDIMRPGEPGAYRAESNKIDKTLGKARDDFRAAAQAALESGAEEL